jgi:cysteine desulfurase
VDPVNIAGFGTALARLGEHAASQSRLRVLRDKLEHELSDFMQRNVEPSLERLNHVTSLFALEWPAEELVAAMDLEGVCISAGSACSAGTAEVSPVIEAMLGTARARSTVRISLGELTTDAEIVVGLEAFHRVLRRS